MQTQKHDQDFRTGYATGGCKVKVIEADIRTHPICFGLYEENTTKVRNIKQYLLTTLYNAPITISNYYGALVNHDLHGGGK